MARPANNDRVLYLVDGDILCGRLKCIGADAYYSGVSPRGMPVGVVTQTGMDTIKRATGRKARCSHCGRAAK